MRRARLLLAAVAVLAAAAVAAGCGGGSSGRLVVYSGRTQELVGPLLERFSEETGIAITVQYGDSADLALQIAAEGDTSPADVVISQSPGAVGYLDGEGRLVRLPDRVLEAVPARFRADDGRWVGLSGRVRVVVYNTEKVDPSELPGSVFDLTDRRYRGRVGLAPANGSFQDFVTGMRSLVGDDRTLEWLQGMNDNLARTYASNLAIREAVERGEIDFGLVNHYYNEQAKAERGDVPTENHFLDARDPGTMILTTAAAVLDTNDRGDEAARLVEFLLSREAQAYFSEVTFEYPLAAGVEPAVDLPPLRDIEAPRVDLSALGGGLARTRQLIVESGLEAG
jgi:iron(III) transport system substrate-binding protein